MIIAGNCQYAAMRGSAEGVGVFEHIAASVYAGAFAVPNAQNAILAKEDNI